MGASNIIICGHDCGSIDGFSQIKNYNTDFNETIMKGKNYINWLKNIESHTKSVSDAITKEYSCNIYSLNPFLNLNATGHKYVHSSKYFFIRTAFRELLIFSFRRLKLLLKSLTNFSFEK